MASAAGCTRTRTSLTPERAAGHVLYVLDEGDMGVALGPGVVGVIAPERPHHVEPDDARFFVRFSRRGS
jgi:hypothetical protein